MDRLKCRSYWIEFLVIFGSFILCFQILDAASTNANTNVCQTDACKNIANSIIQKMNQSVNPCDNFYEFVCGNFSRNAVIPPSRSIIDLFNEIMELVQNQLKNNIENHITGNDCNAFQKTLTYYKTCMNEAQIEQTSTKEFLQILKKLGGWPVLLGNQYPDTKFNWVESVMNISRMGYSSSYFLSVDIAKDLKNSTKNVLYLDQTAFGIPQEYLSGGLEHPVVSAYFKYMVDVAEIFGVKREQAKVELQESLNFEIELAKISLSDEERRDTEKQYNPMKISELQKKYPYISWLKYLNALFSPYFTLTEDEVVIVSALNFFEKFGDLLNRTPKRVLANYVMWRVTAGSANMLGQKVRYAKLEFSATTTGNRNKIPRWQTCVRVTSSQMYVATSALYVRRNFDKATKDGVLNMIKHLRQSFRNILLELDWMDEKTRAAALKKLEQIIPLVGYFDESLDDKKINDYYKDFKVCPKSFLKTVLSYRRFDNVKQLKSFGDPVSRVDWTYPYYASDVVNAFYSPSGNTIQFPAGILQGDFYTEGNPKYVNYASIGSIIGHEMTHGFDDQGSHFDGEGNVVDWWQAETKKEFEKRSKCIADQYSSYNVPQMGININGNLTLGENIADNGGLKEAYLAYTIYEEENGKEPILPGFEGFVPRQLFWISYGNIWCEKYRYEYLKDQMITDAHSPSSFRLIGSLANNPQFAKDFNCPAGSFMNPVSKCSVW